MSIQQTMQFSIYAIFQILAVTSIFGQFLVSWYPYYESAIKTLSLTVLKI